jgi:UDP-glucose 4-epimerase
LFAHYKPVAVIHFAGLKAVGESVSKPLEYYDVNVGGSIKLLKQMKKHNCNTLIFSSSATVYGGLKTNSKEDDAIAPTNPYGWNKAMIE